MFRLGFVLLFVVFNSTTSPSQLRPSNVSAGDQLSITATKTVLGVGESTQLRVTLKQANGESFDVTHTAGIRYTTSIAILAIPELDGRITCISTNGEPFEITDAIAIYGNLRAQLHLYLRSEGPGQTLTISPAKKTLREGESIEYHIFSKSDGTDLTTSSQNHYLVIARYNTPDADAIYIDSEKGIFTAMKNLGEEYQQLHPLIFVRNGDLVGWLELRIIKRESDATAK